ncbi:6-phosphogluconate dehydrogenase [Halenospora varia]|nr:6-phosphogluconate dehydrogenase [Halenospora varia]
MSKCNVLLVGSGGVGTMAAYNLEVGGLATVTSVLRSNHEAVMQNGFTITSLDHGFVKGWKPTKILKAIPDVKTEGFTPFDLIVVTTKNIADVPPTVAQLIAPAVTPGHTSIMLLQNGLNIERPLIAAFPTNPILSGVSLIGAAETSPSHILHDDRDRLIVGAFENPNIPLKICIDAARQFVHLYSASGKVQCTYDENVGFVRWRKLIYNSTYNGVCALTEMDTSRMRYAKEPIEDVIRPLMWEVWRIAKAKGHLLPEEIVENMINCDPEDTFFKPSMQQDIEKGNYIEFENIVGEPLREAEAMGVPAPGLKMVYGLLKILQLKIKEKKGLISYPSPQDPTRPMLHMEPGSHVPT